MVSSGFNICLYVYMSYMSVPRLRGNEKLLCNSNFYKIQSFIFKPL